MSGLAHPKNAGRRYDAKRDAERALYLVGKACSVWLHKRGLLGDFGNPRNTAQRADARRRVNELESEGEE